MESVSGDHWPSLWIWKAGKFSPEGCFLNKASMAATGQIGEFPNLGIKIVAKSFLFCMVFDHFTSMVAESWEIKMSPLC